MIGQMKPNLQLVWVTLVALLTITAAKPCRADQLVGVGGKCLDILGGRTSNGTPVQIWPCGRSFLNQRWAFIDGALVGYANKCLDAEGGQTDNGTPAVMWDCHPGSPGQHWDYHDGQIVGIDGKCLDVSGGSSDDGTHVVLWDCHGGPNQNWSRLPSVIDR